MLACLRATTEATVNAPVHSYGNHLFALNNVDAISQRWQSGFAKSDEPIGQVESTRAGMSNSVGNRGNKCGRVRAFRTCLAASRNLESGTCKQLRRGALSKLPNQMDRKNTIAKDIAVAAPVIWLHEHHLPAPAWLNLPSALVGSS